MRDGVRWPFAKEWRCYLFLYFLVKKSSYIYPFCLSTGLSHMRESVLLHEESLRLQRMCRDLKKRDHLSTFLRRAHDAALDAYTRALGDDEFGEALDPPPILGIRRT